MSKVKELLKNGMLDMMSQTTVLGQRFNPHRRKDKVTGGRTKTHTGSTCQMTIQQVMK